MGLEFFQTVMGQRFYEGTMPMLAKAAQSIAIELKRYNDREESAVNVTQIREDLGLAKYDLQDALARAKEKYGDPEAYAHIERLLAQVKE